MPMSLFPSSRTLESPSYLKFTSLKHLIPKTHSSIIEIPHQKTLTPRVLFIIGIKVDDLTTKSTATHQQSMEAIKNTIHEIDQRILGNPHSISQNLKAKCFSCSLSTKIHKDGIFKI